MRSCFTRNAQASWALFLLLFISGNLWAQPTIQWQKCLGGNSSEIGLAIRPTSDGGYIMAGETASVDGIVAGQHGQQDAWVVKLSSTGAVQWQKAMGGTLNDAFYAVQQTSDGGYILAGETHSTNGDVAGNHSNGDFWVVKLSSSGALQWQKCLGGSGWDLASGVAQSSDGGFIVSGTTWSNNGDVTGNHGQNDYWVVKLSSTGSLVWQKALGGSSQENAYGLSLATDGSIWVSGSAYSNDGDISGSHGGMEAWVVKLSSTGSISWQKCYGGTSIELSSAIQATSDGGAVFAGNVLANNGDVSGVLGNYDYWVVKINSTGTLQWQKCLGGTAFDYPFAITQTTDGGYVVTGETESTDGDLCSSLGLKDLLSFKLSSTGNLQWSKNVGGMYSDWARAVAATSDGGFVAAGCTYSNNGDVSGHYNFVGVNGVGADAWVVKFAPGSTPVTPSISITANPGSIICTGNNVTFTAAISNGGSTPTYQWKRNGLNIGTNSASYSSSSLVNGDVITCELTSSMNAICPTKASSNAITMTVNANAAPSVSITASPSGPISSGTNVTFTATPVNGGTAPSYQWKLNGANVGTNSNMYSSSTLANGNTITCVLTSNSPCATTSTATSNTITMSVLLVPSVTITASPSGTVCTGATVTFTAVPVNGGTAPVYQWKKNGVNVGTNSATYVGTGLINGNTITCVMTSNAPGATPPTVTSNTITMSVTTGTPVTPTISITRSPSGVTCYGSPVTFTATITNGGTAPAYQWKVNGTNAGTNSASFSSSTLNSGDVVTCILSSNAPCATSGTATSNAITMTVNGSVTSGQINTIAGTGNDNYNGDNLDALSTSIGPTNLAMDAAGNIYIADYSNARVRKLNAATGLVTTIAGNNIFTNSGDGGPATAANFQSVWDVALDAAGNIFVLSDGSVRKINASTGIITRVAGNGDWTSSTGDGGPATSASFSPSYSICLDPSGNLYISEMGNHRIRKVNMSTGIITTISGSVQGYAGDGAAATGARFYELHGINTDAAGNIYICDRNNNRVRKITVATGIITTVAGTGVAGFSGDGGLATAARLNQPEDVYVDAAGNIYISDTYNQRVRKVDASTGIITTIAGTGGFGNFSGDGGAATNAQLNTARGIQVDASGNIYVVDRLNYRIRKINGGTPNNPATAPTIVADNPTICPGNTVNLGITSGNLNSASAWKWYTASCGGTLVGTGNSLTVNPAVTTTYYVRGEGTCVSNGACGTVTVTVGPPPAPSVSITANPSGTISSGTSVTFMATPVNGGTMPAYQWKVNGVNAGTNSSIFTSTTLADNDAVTCILTSNATCISPNTATSNAIIMDVTIPFSSGMPWTWMKGDNINNVAGVYGSIGVPAMANKPGARSMAYSWTDNTGNFWLFGGGNATGALYNDLWRYTPATNMWTWMKGSSTANAAGVYGTQGVAAAANTPGARGYGATWKDQNGNLWLYGGGGASAWYNDLWMYNIATNQWTWVKGSNLPNPATVTGTLGVAAAGNTPGIRQTPATWSDNNGNLYLMGGSGNNPSGSGGTFNDLWKYNIASGLWTWIGGTTIINDPGNYGTQGVTAASNYPGARHTAVSWVDASGKFWLFGGDKSNGLNNYMNDLWIYDPVTNLWTWKKGQSSSASSTASYGTMGTAAASNLPGGKSGATGWRDAMGNLWLFGGLGGDANGTKSYLNDLWKYEISSNNWTWMDGSNFVNEAGVYGTQGVSDPANHPGARTSGRPFTDANGNFWMFGGYGRATSGTSMLNDLWKLGACSGTGNAITPATATICTGGSQVFTTSGGTSYQWLLNGTPIAGATGASYTATQAGNYSAQIMAGNCVIPSSNTAVLTITTPVVPTVTIVANPSGPILSGTPVTFTATPGNGGTAPAYQWKLNGIPVGSSISTYTNSSLINGDIVTCVMTSNAGCITTPTATSNAIIVVVVPSVTPTITITANPSGAICVGTSVTFSSIITNGGTAPVYQWKVNGVNAGTNASTFTSSTLQNGDVVSCVLTSNATGANPPSVTSNSITMTVTGGAGGIITSVAGGGVTLGDNGPALNAQLNSPTAVAIDAAGNQYIADFGNHRIRKVDKTTGIITTIAGTGTPGFSGDGGLATAAKLNIPQGVAVDALGNVYIADRQNSRVRKVNAATGIITTIAGNGTYGYSGDGGPASAAVLNGPQDIDVDAAGNIYFTDGGNNRIRKINAATNVITTLATLTMPQNICVDGPGNLYYVDDNTIRIYKLSTSGVTTLIAGSGISGFAGDGSLATTARFNQPTGIAVDASGNLYVADQMNHRIRKVTAATGIISTVAGTGIAGLSGDGGMATLAKLNWPANVAIDASGSVYVADMNNGRIRKFTASTPSTPASTPTVSATPATACQGTSRVLAITSGSLNSASEWKWYSGSCVGTLVGTGTTLTVNPSVTTIYYVRGEGNCIANGSCGSVTVTVTPIVTPTISITANPGLSVCAGTNITFTATITNGGATPLYQWKKNGINVGTSSATYMTTALNTSDIISCVLISNAVCATPSSVTSNELTVTVTPMPSGSITPASATICPGTTQTLTTSGGSSYQWYRTGILIPGATASSYVATTAGVYSVNITSNGCTAASSNTANIAMGTAPSGSVSPASATVCDGVSQVFTATGGTSYQWSLNGVVIPGATSAAYSATQAGTYTASISNGSCTANASNSATLIVKPVPAGNISPTSAALCNGNAQLLTVTGGTSFQWKKDGIDIPGATASSYSVSTAGTYSVILTDNGCSAPAGNSVVVTVITTPSSVISPASAFICPGSSQLLTVSGGSAYQWKKDGIDIPGATAATFTATEAGTYSVMVFNGSCSGPATNTAVVTMGTLPTGSISPATATVCDGASQTFTATGGGAYQWSHNGVAISGANAATYTATGAGTYSVMITNGGCSAPAANTASLTLTSIPSGNISPASAIICAGGSQLLTATGGTDHQWFRDGIAIPGTGSTINATVAGTYSVILGNNGCTAAAGNTAVISMGTAPSGNISPATATICAGGNQTFTANGGTNYQWIKDGTPIAGAVSATYNATQAGTYSVQIFNGTCSGPASNAGVLTVTPLPSGNITPATAAICPGATQLLTAAGGSSYQWSVNGIPITGATAATYTASAAGNYAVVISDGSCTAPAANQSTISQLMPVTASITITANPSGPILTGTAVTFTAAATNGGSTPVYQWKKNGVTVGANSISYTDNNLADGDIISCLLTSNANCVAMPTVASNNIVMNVVATVTPTITISASATTVCAGTAITYSAQVTNEGSTPVYQWKKNGVNAGTNAAVFVDATPANGDQVSCVLTSSLPAAVPATVTSSAITVSVTSVSGTVSPASAEICIGASQLFAATGGSSYQWMLDGSPIAGATSANYLATASGNYTVNVFANSCSGPAANAGKLDLRAATPAVKYASVQVLPGVPATLKARGFGSAYQWMPPSGLSNPSIADPLVTVTADARYTVAITGAANCITVDTVDVIVVNKTGVLVPNAFTPNGDGKNEWLRPSLYRIREIKYFRIYDRWGNIVFETSKPGVGWDGRVRGLELTTASFIWIFEGVDLDGKRVRSNGTVTLIR